MPPQMVSIGGGGADPRLGMEYMETEELGDGISINRHRYNTEFGHNTCDFVSMEDQSPESDEVMWSYEVEDCGAAECNGLYERSDDYGWRNEAPVSIRRRGVASVYVKAKGSPKGCDKVFSLSREEQPVNEARTEFKMGWILARPVPRGHREYSEGLLDPSTATLATLLSNRSECRMRLKDWLEALGDAEDALDALGDDPALTATTAPIASAALRKIPNLKKDVAALALAPGDVRRAQGAADAGRAAPRRGAGLAGFVEGNETLHASCASLPLVRLRTLVRGDEASLCKFVDVGGVRRLQAALLQDDMHCAYHGAALLVELLGAKRCAGRAIKQFFAPLAAPSADAESRDFHFAKKFGAPRRDCLARLQKMSVLTPKAMGFRMDTARYTKNEWATAQRCAAEAAALLCEHKPSAAQEEQRAQSAKAKVARAKARAAGGGARAAAGERTTTKADAILGYPLKQMFKDGATKAEDDDGDEDAEVEDAVGALELVAEELEALVADPRRKDEVDGWISALSEDRAWGFLAPLIHGPPPLAEARAARPGGLLPRLPGHSPRGHEPLRTHVPELYKTSRRARNAAATVLGACGRTAGFNQGVDDDERRSLSTLQALLEAADQDPNAEATLRFVENVIVPMWRTATPHGEPRKALSSLLRGMLRDETFMQKLLINFEKRGRVGLFNSLTNELRCEDLGDSAQLFEREANSARLGILDDLKQVGRDPDVKDEEDYVSEVLVNGNVKLVRADARAKALSEFEALKEMGPYDVIYLQNAKDYVVDFEPFFADLAKHLLVKPSGKLCFLEDKDFGFVLGDDAVHAGLVEDDASGECVVLQKGRDLFIFGYEDGPGFPLPGSPIPAPRAKKADAMLKGGKEAGLLDLD
ncbi:hypothetical protein JL722_13785 [Aureococcus anophagefferens]|nr:hypothetical protein JL722_13785 [Aureococcus anophagefferens]